MTIASKSGDNNGVMEFQFEKHQQRTKWETFRRAIYNPDTKEILGRTDKSWGQLLLFYALFYIVLGALFAICMQGLFATLNENEPKWQLDSSLIGTNPGLGFRPISPRTEEGSLISYNVTNATTIHKWVNLIDEFLAPYKAQQVGENYVNCDFDKSPGDGQVCTTNVSQFQNCGPDVDYGYNSSSLCVFLKLNRIIGWVPEYYTEPEDGMPPELAEHIKGLPMAKRDQVWVSCDGEDSVDKELLTKFNYYPHGFAGYYYPYRNYKNYLSPVIAVQILNPGTNTVISIECRAWAKNIAYSASTLAPVGSVRFQIMVDTENNQV